MQNRDMRKTAIEAGKVLDTLAALSVRLSCHTRDVSPDKLVLGAGALTEACTAIDDAVSSLKQILTLADAGDNAILDDGGE